jgi:DNA repair exonuclease SbcCD ATPase subunit
MPEPPQDPDKVEDFASLWKKQKESNSKSVIGEFMTRIEELESENVRLRGTIQRDIDLITKTESIVKKAIEDKEQLEKEIRAKEEKLKEKTEELSMLKIESSIPSPSSEPPAPAITQADLAVNISLIEDLQSQLSKRKNQIRDYENLIKINESRIIELTKANESLMSEIEARTSSEPLEQLCKDLQDEINRYKRTVEKLKEENQSLKEDAEKSKQKGKIAELKKENEELKEENARVKSQLVALGSVESEYEDLQKLVKEKDKRIDELNATIASQPQTQGGAISGLVDELQSKINKLKNALNEKNKIIESLKKP